MNHYTHITGKLILTVVTLYIQVLFLNGIAQNINNPNKTGPMGLQVNTFTGNLFFSRTDLFIPARGIDLAITFHYNSFSFNHNSPYGNGWSLGYNIQYVSDAGKNITVVWGDGREDSYTYNGATFATPSGFFTQLQEYEPGKFILIEKDGSRIYFDNSKHKRITKMSEPNGNELIFSYTDSLLTQINTSAGHTITLAYQNGKLSAVTDGNGTPTRNWTFGYDNGGNLIHVKDPLNQEFKYSYLVNGPLKEIRDRNANVVNVIYYSDYAVSEIIGCNQRISFTYDQSTLATVVTDHMQSGEDQITKYRYKKSGDNTWLAGMEGNCCGFKMDFEYDDAGNKIKEIDANGNITRYTYDAYGNVTTVTDALGQIHRYTYTSDFHFIKTMTDPKGFTSELFYDNRGNLLQIKDPDNRIYTSTYAPNGDILSSTDPMGNTYTYQYDAFGNPVQVSGPLGYKAKMAFDTRGRLLSYTDSKGNTSITEYDILNRLQKITDPLNQDFILQYDANGNLVKATNQNKEDFYLTYDASNRPVTLKDPIGQQESVSYDERGNVLSLTNVLGQKVTLKYDQQNRMTKATNNIGETMEFSYDNNGNLATLGLPNGQKISYEYDALDRLTETIDNHGSLIALSYDANGNIERIKNGTGATTTAVYDNLGRPTKITDMLGNLILLQYDENNRVTKTTDRNGNSSSYTYDSRDRVASFTDPLGAKVQVSYDDNNNVTGLTDQNGNKTHYTYDQLDRLEKTTYPDGKFMEYSYDNKSNIKTVKLTDGNIISFTYDTLNRLISKNLPDGSTFSYTYDAQGNIKTATNKAGTVQFSYDNLNRIISETFKGRTVNYSYHLGGRTQTTTYPDGTLITMEYDTRHRLQTVRENGNQIAHYTYNNANQLLTRTLANGVTTSYQYDVANRLIGYSTGTLQQTKITYDKQGNKTSIIRSLNPSMSEHFTYDNNHRLVNYKRGSVESPNLEHAYAYDALGNRTSTTINGTTTTYTSNNLNQLTKKQSGSIIKTLEYDAIGNMTFDGTFYKTYDAEKRLVKDSASPSLVISYYYDAFGRRVGKILNGQLYEYDFAGITPVGERINGQPNTHQVMLGFLVPVTISKSNHTYYYLQNELGSIEALTNASGRLIERYEYDPYGNQKIYDSLGNVLAGSLVGNRFGFTGQLYDSATASNGFYFRNYSPELGVFQQRDLIGYADGMGLYQYVGNNPANGVDVWGLLQTKDPCYHDPKKIRFITNKTIEKHRNKMKRYVNGNTTPYVNGGFNPIAHGSNLVNWLVENGPAGLQADSYFYSEFTENHGSENFYFNGSVQKSWSVNYYFTAFALAGMNTGSLNASFMVNGWDGGKAAWGSLGAAATLKNPLNAWKARMVDNSDKNNNLKAAYEDYNNLERNQQANRAMNIPEEYENKTNDFGEWWPVINPKTKELGYEFFPKTDLSKSKYREFTEWYKKNCLPNNNNGGTRKPSPYPRDPQSGKIIILGSYDPNEIIGPEGQPDKRWVSVNDRLPYTINFENDTIATAPAKAVRITAPIHPKMDAATLELGNFGFNSLGFDIPAGTSAYYQRLDCRDSLGIFVDITAGFDVVNNQAFWLFQSIDPITLQTPTDPLKGLLLLQDTANPTYGHGYVKFTIKPQANAVTLDSILAEAVIIFDQNEEIATNVEMNTIDAFAPNSHLNSLPPTSPSEIQLRWSGTDDPNGCGIRFYTLYVSEDGVNFNIVRTNITRTDTTLSGKPGTTYHFFVLATDSVGNTEKFRSDAIQSTFVGNALPASWLYFTGTNQGSDNLLRWATANERNVKDYWLERSTDAATFKAISKQKPNGGLGRQGNYEHLDERVDRLKTDALYYRVKQVDNDGSYQYSSTIKIAIRQQMVTKTIVYPNPTRSQLTIAVGSDELVGTTAVILDNRGRVIKQIILSSNNHVMNLDGLPAGMYYIRLKNGEVLKVMKQ
jgi:RHS repeat-associated protein